MAEDYSTYYNSYARAPQISISYGKVTLSLIIVCVLVYIFLPAGLYPLFMFNSDTFLSQPWTIITNAFLHADIIHLLFNCFSLFMFGTILELRHGSKFVTLLFLLSVPFGNLMFGIFNPGIYGLGISGYIYGLIGAAVLLEPRARIIFPIGYIYTTAPISVAGPIMFAGEIILALLSSDGVGHIAHAGGFLIGILLGWIKRKFFPKSYYYED